MMIAFPCICMQPSCGVCKDGLNDAYQSDYSWRHHYNCYRNNSQRRDPIGYRPTHYNIDTTHLIG